MAFTESREKERFSLDDPEAGRKLVENLDARKVRLAFSEICWHFRCTEYDEKMRLRNFLIGLDSQGLVLEVLPNLYCRPALSGGSSDAASVRKAAKKIARIRRVRQPEADPAGDQETASLPEAPPPTDDVA